MITQLQGILIEKELDRVVIEVQGIGYLVAVSLQTIQALPQTGQNVLLYTHFHIREDAFTLFGFATKEERTLFEQCISVSGVGPKLALSLLSGLEPQRLRDAILRSDVQQLSKIPGIGKKTSERLIVELRDKMAQTSHKTTNDHKEGSFPRVGDTSTPFREVVTALCNLGYRPNDAEKAADHAIKTKPDVGLADLLRTALRFLQKN